MKLSLPNALSTRVARQGLLAQKHSPQVLFYGGLVLMAGTVVSACKATLQLEEVLNEIDERRETLEAAAVRMPEEYSSRQIAKLNTYVTVRGGAKIVKLYLPTLALGVAAVACLTSSHNQLTRRNAGLSAALAATERALDSYRNRVRDEYGQDKELELWRGEKTETVEVKDEDGKTKKKKVKTGGGHSPYARVWGQDTSSEWDPESTYNLSKLRTVQEWGTIQLNHKGHLMLNEIFDELGLSRTPAGAVVGWLSLENGGQDGFVDLGVLEHSDPSQFLDFVTGREDHILLDFNVDGEIWRQI